MASNSSADITSSNGHGLLEWQRYEAKYIIAETQAREIRRYCLAHLPQDPHSILQPGFEYPILSVYLDSPDLALYHDTIDRKTNRFKLRVRSYHRPGVLPQDDGPLYFEIKRKISGLVYKSRVPVPAGLADMLLHSRFAYAHGRSRMDAATWDHLSEFLRLRDRLRATPIIGVAYDREAYEQDSSQRTRITLDRGLHYGMLSSSRSGLHESWWPVDAGGVILEIKFTNTYPFWVSDMLHRVEVIRRGVCKYVICTQGAGRHMRRLDLGMEQVLR